jgi:MoxR-like ATPase
MTPSELTTYLGGLLSNQLKMSVMIWGAPGIGKSSIVAQVTEEAGIGCIDLRLSQLAPTDLRGLPVADEGVSRWYPPEFLPRDGRGVLFLDEINMAPPTMQGVAQQLILDRRVGSYTVPEGWFIWAAGNRKEDRAAVFDMPAPLANRFVHLEVEVDFDSFKAHALGNDFHEQVVAFLSYRPQLLHKIDPKRPAWPSPRSWELASWLHGAELDIAPAVGEGPAAEFSAFVSLYRDLPDLAKILSGKAKPSFPREPSHRYALVLALISRGQSGNAAMNALRYLAEKAPPEWAQLYAADAIPLLRRTGKLADLARLLRDEPAIAEFMRDFRDLIGLPAGPAPKPGTPARKKKAAKPRAKNKGHRSKS